MVTTEQGLSLCMTCVRARGCMLRANADHNVFDCDEYLDGPVAPWGESWQVCDPIANPTPDVDNAAGLCGTCDNRATCAIRALDGTVWQCEEYC